MLKKLMSGFCITVALTAVIANAQGEKNLDYTQYVNDLMKHAKEIQKQNPNMPQTEVLNEARRRALSGQSITINGADYETGKSQKDLVPEAQLLRATTTDIIPNNIKQLRIQIDPTDTIRIAKSTDAITRISILALSVPTIQNGAANLIKSLQFNEKDGQYTLVKRAGNYYCVSSRINGALSLDGACLQTVTVSIAEGSDLIVYDKDGKRLTQLDRPLSNRELLENIKSVHSFDKLKTLKAALDRQKDLRLTAEDAYKICENIGSFDAEKAAILVAPRINSEIGPALFEKFILLSSFDSDRMKIFKQIYQKTNKENNSILIEVVHSSFSFSDSKEEAVRLLIRR